MPKGRHRDTSGSRPVVLSRVLRDAYRRAMQPIRQNKRKGRPLLIAAVGLASVSYVGTLEGCADIDPAGEQSEGLDKVVDDVAEGVSQSQQALSVSNAAINQAIFKPRLPPSGNLMPGPAGTAIGGGGGVIIKVPIPVGNLMAPVEPIDPVAVDLLENAVLEQR
jgi:hypothetical protein